MPLSDRVALRPRQLALLAGLVLVCVSIIPPTLLAARAAARGQRCSENMRQLGGGVLAYAHARDGELPATGFNSAGWGTQILPYLGHEEVYNSYHWDVSWDDPENAEVVAVRLSEFVCPEGPHPDRVIKREDSETEAAPSDYIALLITLNQAVQAQFPPGFNPLGVIPVRGNLFRSGTRLADVTDGLSTTGMLFESADKPYRWQSGVLSDKEPTGRAGAWAGGALNGFRTYTEDGKEFPGPKAVNANNSTGIYGFHPGGAYIVNADGAVHFISEDVEAYVMYALVSRSGGELITAEDFQFEAPSEEAR